MTIRWGQVFMAATAIYMTASGLSFLTRPILHEHNVNRHDGTWCMTLNADNTPQVRYGAANCGL